MKHYCRSQILVPKGIGNGVGERSRPQRLELSHFEPTMGQSDVCETVRSMRSNTARAAMPAPQNGTVPPRSVSLLLLAASKLSALWGRRTGKRTCRLSNGKTDEQNGRWNESRTPDAVRVRGLTVQVLFWMAAVSLDSRQKRSASEGASRNRWPAM
jgi:hypothetical protein